MPRLARKPGRARRWRRSSAPRSAASPGSAPAGGGRRRGRRRTPRAARRSRARARRAAWRTRAQALRHRVLHAQLLVHARGAREPARARRPGLRARPTTLRRRRAWPGCGRAPDRASTAVTEPSAAIDHLDDDGEPILVVVERGQVGRQPLRQHREDLGRRGVDRRRVGPGVRVDRRALLDQRVDVGDRDQDLDAAACERLARRELVEVERIVVVDRAPEQRVRSRMRGVGVVRRAR